MQLRERIIIRIVTITRNFVRHAKNRVYNWFPEVPRFLERHFPHLKSRLGQATRTEYRTPDERRRNDEIVTLLTNLTYQQIVEVMLKEEARGGYSYLRDYGFKQIVDSFDFRIVPCDSKVDDKSLVEIQRLAGGDVQIKIDFFRVRNSVLLFGRLVNFVVGYWNGIGKILDYELDKNGRMGFYLCLEDSYEINSNKKPNASFYAFSRPKTSSDVGLVPDLYALANLNSTENFSALRNLERARAEFANRKEIIFWRGSTTGRFRGSGIKKNKRVEFCMRSLEYPDYFDLRITSAVQDLNTKRARRKLAEIGVIGGAIPESEFGNYMAYLDLEGNASAWGTFRKYLQHSHIIKLEGEFSHFFDFLQVDGSNTLIADFDDLIERLHCGEITIDNFEVAHRGYLSALNALSAIASGDATVFPICSK